LLHSGASPGPPSATKGPVWSWYDYDQKRRDGGPVEHITLLDGNPPRPLSPRAYIVRNVEMSRLTSPIRVDLMLAFVVVDSRSADGLTVRQLGDATAMMGLSMINYQAVSMLTQSSALQLLADRSSRGRIDGLTDFDRAYLSTLYSEEPGIGEPAFGAHGGEHRAGRGASSGRLTISRRVGRAPAERRICNPFPGVQERTRTSTPLRAPAPKAGASTNYAAWALDGVNPAGRLETEYGFDCPQCTLQES
jgi:hypothetical protein